MKTTIDIDDELFRAAKIQAVETRRPFREVVDAALRAYLRAGGASADRSAEAADRDRRVALLLAELDALPVLDERSPEELLGYDETGTFR